MAEMLCAGKLREGPFVFQDREESEEHENFRKTKSRGAEDPDSLIRKYS